MAGERSEDLKRLLDEAFQAFEQGDDERARRLCREALSIDPQSSTAHSLMGLLYEREGRAAGLSDEPPPRPGPRSAAAAPTAQPATTTPSRSTSRRAPTGIYVTAALLALLVGGSVLFGISRLGNRASAATPNLRSASLDDDLALARDAYSQGDYQTALSAAQRVLQSDPNNASAREIYDRSSGFLQGLQQPRALPRATPQRSYPAPATTPGQAVPGQTAPSQAAPNQPQPQASPQRSVSGAGGSIQPQTVYSQPALQPGQSTSAVPRPTTASSVAPLLPPQAAPELMSMSGIDYSVPGTPYSNSSSGRSRTTTPSEAPAYDPTAGTRPQTNFPSPSLRGNSRPSTSGVRRAPLPSTLVTPLQPVQPPTANPQGQSSGRIKIEVHQPPQQPAEPQAEVTPDMAPTPAASKATEDRQRELRELRERQQAAQRRRAEQLQGD